MSVEWSAVRRALSTYRKAPVRVQARVTARYVGSPLGTLSAEVRRVSGVVLSLGCGYAAIERYLLEVNPHITIEGVEPDPAKVDVFNSLVSGSDRLSVRQGDVVASPQPLAYDAVIVCDALHELAYDAHEPLASAVERALTPGGVCIIKDLDQQPRWKYRANLLHHQIANADGPVSCRSPQEMARLFARAGLDVERAQRIDRSWTPHAHYLIRARKPA